MRVDTPHVSSMLPVGAHLASTRVGLHAAWCPLNTHIHDMHDLETMFFWSS